MIMVQDIMKRESKLMVSKKFPSLGDQEPLRRGGGNTTRVRKDEVTEHGTLN